ncbi:hypothetical protein LLG10_08380 [bacterium]|nr:hypothetical protein [bacterium]
MMKTRNFAFLVTLILIVGCQSCKSSTTSRQITLMPSSRYQMETKPNISISGQFAEIPSPAEDQITCFLSQNGTNQVFTLQGKADWGMSYRFSSSESDFPKPVFCLSKQFLVMIDANACYKVNTIVNTKTELFTYSEIAYDQEWVIWKEIPRNTSQRPASATIMNWQTEEKLNIKISSDIQSMKYCAGYLLISTQVKPDDTKKWWVFDTKTQKIASIQAYGDRFYSLPKSDVIYWTSEEKSEWTLFSLATRKVLKRIPYSVLPEGLIIPYTQNAQEAFWFTQNTKEASWGSEKAVSVELIHGMLDEQNRLQMTPLRLPDAYRLPVFMPEIEPCLWLPLADNPGKFYRLYYSSSDQYKLDEILFPVQDALQEPVYLTSALTGPSNMTILATTQTIYSFSVKEVVLIVE